MKENFQRLPGLFWGFLKISTFTLGGGAVMLPLMEEEFVRRRGWITHEQMLDVYTLTNSLPGVIAVNSSLVIGRLSAGAAGSVAGLTGALLPPFLIILALATFVAGVENAPLAKTVFLGIRSGAAALILTVLIRLARKQMKGLAEVLLAAGAFTAVRFIDIHPLIVILAAGTLGLVLFREDR